MRTELSEIDKYIVDNYQTETARQIAEKFGVRVQTIGGALNRLSRIDVLDKSLSYNKQQKTTLSSLSNKTNKSKKFTNHNGSNKKQVRALTAEMIVESSGYRPKILTMPAGEWLWEEALLEADEGGYTDFQFYAVERDSVIFDDMVNKRSEDPWLQDCIRSMQNEAMNTVIRRSLEDDYAHAILDYCGTINTCYDDLQLAFKNNIVARNGLYIITLSKMIVTHDIKSHTRQFLDAIPHSIFGGKRSESTYATIGLINKLIGENDYRYVIEKFIEYKDTSPMMVFVIRRIK